MHTQNLGKVTESSHNLINNNPFKKKANYYQRKLRLTLLASGLLLIIFLCLTGCFFYL